MSLAKAGSIWALRTWLYWKTLLACRHGALLIVWRVIIITTGPQLDEFMSQIPHLFSGFD